MELLGPAASESGRDAVRRDALVGRRPRERLLRDRRPIGGRPRADRGVFLAVSYVRGGRRRGGFGILASIFALSDLATGWRAAFSASSLC